MRKIQPKDIDELKESYEEDSPELQKQIREGYEAYLRGEGSDAEKFLAELERELEVNKTKRVVRCQPPSELSPLRPSNGTSEKS